MSLSLPGVILGAVAPFPPPPLEVRVVFRSVVVRAVPPTIADCTDAAAGVDPGAFDGLAELGAPPLPRPAPATGVAAASSADEALSPPVVAAAL